ncbi:MAG: hypothetical protein MUP55_04110 [Candidatus Aenigmarchaeota archaeon]|nr:hypothetical protein [Candidatus Aenigmarchaeota archaeon]
MTKIKFDKKQLEEWKQFSSWARDRIEREKDKMSKGDYEWSMEVFTADPKHIMDVEGLGNILIALAIGSMYDEYRKEQPGDMEHGQNKIPDTR